MLKIIGPRLLMLLALAALVYFGIRPNAGERQMQRTEAALKKATSWRMHMWATDPSVDQEFTEEVMCPDSKHQLQEIKFHSNGTEMDTESFLVPGYKYEKNPGQQWKRYTATRAVYVPCYGEPPLLKDGNFPSLRQVLARASIKKGEQAWVGSDVCRNWDIKFQSLNGMPTDYVYCISETDNLPREMRTIDSSIKMQYTDWNQTIDIQPPPGDYN
jgi:hypothetical protein